MTEDIIGDFFEYYEGDMFRYVLLTFIVSDPEQVEFDLREICLLADSIAIK